MKKNFNKTNLTEQYNFKNKLNSKSNKANQDINLFQSFFGSPVSAVNSQYDQIHNSDRKVNRRFDLQQRTQRFSNLIKKYGITINGR